MLDYKPNIVLSNEEFNVVGTRPVRPDGAEKVTGRGAIRRGPEPARSAPRQDTAQPSFTRQNQVDRHQRG